MHVLNIHLVNKFQKSTAQEFGEICNNEYGNINRFEIHIKEQVTNEIIWD